MDTGRNDLLGEIAADAALERSDFLVQSTDQLRRFLDRHKERLAAYGGLTLIDEEPDYLSIAPDLSFRSRSRFQDETSGEWISETEVIESASELVELYNPADIYAAFGDAAREAAGYGEAPTAAEDLLETAGISPEETITLGEDPYAAAADSWAAGQGEAPALEDDEAAARRLYDLALEYQERSQRSESRLLDEFEVAAAGRFGAAGRPGHRRRRRRAPGAHRDRRVPCRGHPRGSRRVMAHALRRGPARRVLRPHRRVRGSRRRPRRGLSGRGAGRCRGRS